MLELAGGTGHAVSSVSSASCQQAARHATQRHTSSSQGTSAQDRSWALLVPLLLVLVAFWGILG